MADRYSYYTNNSTSRGRSPIRNEDFDEEDVWDVVRKDNNSKGRKPKDPSPVSNLRRIPTASKMILRTKSSINGAKMQQSAPVNIPDWSKIYRKNTHKSTQSSWTDDDTNDDHGRYNDDEVDDGDEDEWVPPHEWIAKKLARSQISSFSVCEGAGRTLKDTSKVVNVASNRIKDDWGYWDGEAPCKEVISGFKCASLDAKYMLLVVWTVILSYQEFIIFRHQVFRSMTLRPLATQASTSMTLGTGDGGKSWAVTSVVNGNIYAFGSSI
ncbi:hypothetical protein IFM89_022185 [Coptis chinensis]|uniref:Uncharacterized protein n=1 Tax=Coptis chinensis TaxID=261450 RepID=A0A835LE97_9MAGN|nr:hypothetical protein IFM89_022185 [Coptis chinensis]